MGTHGEATSTGRLAVISGPSGVGKSTVVRKVLEQLEPHVRLSVSATTRAPRPGEVDGVDYHFLSDEEFLERLAAGKFLEAAEVFGRGHWYGTLWAEVSSSLAAGKWVILEIDVQGASAVVDRFPEAITIFIRTQSLADLEKRLRSRGTETEEAIERRLAVARGELELADRYRHQVINDDIDAAAKKIVAIFHQEGLST